MATTSTPAHLNSNLDLFGFCPEVVHGTRNYKFTASGGSTTTVTVDTSSGTDHNAAIATAADDFFNGLEVAFTVGAEAGNRALITDFAVSGGTATFTFAAMTTGGAASAEFYVLGVVQANDISMDLAYEDLPRDFARQTLDPPPAKKGIKTASGSFKMELPGMLTPSADGSAATEDRISKFLECYGARSAGTGEAVSGSGSTTTQIDVTDATLFAVGDVVMISGEVRYVTAIDTASTPDNITVHSALSAAPAAATLIYRPEVWTPDDSGHRSHTFIYNVDDRLEVAVGCKCSIKLGAEFSQLAMLDVEFDGSNWDKTDAVTLNGVHLDACSPTFGNTAGCWFGTTELYTSSFGHDAAHGRKEIRDTESGMLQFIRTRESTCEVTFRDVNATPKNTWEANGTQATLLLSAGDTGGDAVGVVGNAQVVSIGMENNNDTQYHGASFRFCDPATSATPKKPKLLRF